MYIAMTVLQIDVGIKVAHIGDDVIDAERVGRARKTASMNGHSFSIYYFTRIRGTESHGQTDEPN